MKGNIIFLDIDGVLNNSFTETTTVTGWTFVEDFLIRNLKRIIDATNAKVVLSSSWRWGYWSTGNDRLDYLELVEKLSNFGIFLADITPAFASNDREKEILWWLDNKFESGNFVILDDEPNYFHLLLPYVVKTDRALGITQKEVIKAINMLTNEAE